MIRQINRAAGVRFQVYNQHNGKKVYVGSYDSKRAAQEAEEDDRTTQRKIARGELPPATDTKLTLSIAAARWFKSLEEVQSRSLEEYKRSLELHVLPELGGMPLVNVRRADIITWRDKLSLGSLSHRTVNMVLGVLSSAFSYFVDRDWIATNPCFRVKRLLVKPKVFPWLTSNEIVTRLLGECTPNIQSLVAVLVGTGLRLDEALHLRWDDIDLDHRLITVHRGRKGTTKSGRVRRVPIFNAVLPVLQAMKLSRGSNVMLWPGGKPGKALSQPSIHRPFKRALEHAELPKEMRIHDLRHSFASLFLFDGGDIFKLSRILGHSSVAITERTYAHLKPEAFEEDYGRVAFRMPVAASVVPFRVKVDAAETVSGAA